MVANIYGFPNWLDTALLGFGLLLMLGGWIPIAWAVTAVQERRKS